MDSTSLPHLSLHLTHPPFPSHPLSQPIIILNLHLNRSRPRRLTTRFKGLHAITQIKPMGHQFLHVDHPTLHQPDGTRPRVAIAVLVLQVDFVRGERHERHGHGVGADADHEDFAAEFDTVDCGGDAGFDARAFDCDAWAG